MQNNREITGYTFKSFTEADILRGERNVVEDFEFETLDISKTRRKKREDKKLEISRENARETSFNVLPIVREHKGFKQRDIEEREQRISEEIETRFKEIKDSAFDEGYKEGVEEGKKTVYEQTRIATEEKLSNLTVMINEVLESQVEILEIQKNQIYRLIKNLTKWIVLKELKNDGKYIERLLEKLIIEMRAKSNLFIQVCEKDFKDMPEILKIVQKKVGEFSNVRFEIDYDIKDRGMTLECDNGIINGTLSEQFNSLDNLFESMDVFTEKDENVEVLENDNLSRSNDEDEND